MNITINENKIITWVWDLLSTPGKISADEMSFILSSGCNGIAKGIQEVMTLSQSWEVFNIPKVTVNHISGAVAPNFFNKRFQ